MGKPTRDELKELIRTEPNIAATFAEMNAEYAKSVRQVDAALVKGRQHIEAIGKRRDELKSELDRIADARKKLAALPGSDHPHERN